MKYITLIVALLISFNVNAEIHYDDDGLALLNNLESSDPEIIMFVNGYIRGVRSTLNGKVDFCPPIGPNGEYLPIDEEVGLVKHFLTQQPFLNLEEISGSLIITVVLMKAYPCEEAAE